MKKKINSNEQNISGEWIKTQDGVSKDEACDRIEFLTENYLERLAVDETGWEILYRDPNDGRLWINCFAKSDMYGGEPPELRVNEAEEAQNKFSYS